jgi:hypothetical protein
MTELNEAAPPARRNPLIWIALVVIGLILFVFLSGDREDTMARVQKVDEAMPDDSEAAAGTIERSLLVPPGMRAREFIQQLRGAGKPYPLSQVFDKAEKYQHEGSLADAYLLYFFAARENHLPAMMVMGEMADPLLFRAENSLLDEADPIQAYKWYHKAAELGQAKAADRLEALRRWAIDAAAAGNAQAAQTLLNFQ